MLLKGFGMFSLKTIAGAAAGLVLATGVASASTLIDFTSAATGTSGSVGGVNWTMSSNVGIVNNSQLFDGQDSLASLAGTGLAFQRDGYGVRSTIDAQRNDDEISSMRGGMEAITLTFSKAVKLTSVAFLDLFMPANSKIGEVGYARLSDGTVLSFAGSDIANANGSRRAGYAGSAFAGLVTTSISFYIGLTNDAKGVADGALASISVAPVPVPAAGLLLTAGLGGIAAVRRRRKTA